VRLIPVLTVVLAQLSIGSLLMTSLLPPRIIRPDFFTFNSLLCAVTAAIAWVLSKFVMQGSWADVRFLGLTIIGATMAYGAFRLEKAELGRALLILSSLIGIMLGLVPLAAAARRVTTSAAWIFDAGVLAGALLLGATNVSLILGHWYLLMRRLSFEYLERFSKILLGAIGLRILVFVITLSVLRSYDPQLAQSFLPALHSPQGELFFFLMRILWGLALPAALGVMVLRCVSEKSNQAATGLLYVIQISVLFGELFAAYLLV
jgi:hypothetical protein